MISGALLFVNYKNKKEGRKLFYKFTPRGEQKRGHTLLTKLKLIYQELSSLVVWQMKQPLLLEPPPAEIVL